MKRSVSIFKNPFSYGHYFVCRNDNRYDLDFAALPKSSDFSFKVLVNSHFLLFLTLEPGVNWEGYTYCMA